MVTFILSIVLTAQSTMVSESGFSSLNNNTHHLIDPTYELSVNDVLKDYTSNRTRKASSLSLGFDDAAHWFISSVENSTPTTRWVLEFEYPLLDFIDIYLVRSDGTVEETKIGDRFPFSERYFPSRFLHIPLDVSQNETVTLLWRISTQTSLIAGARIAPEGLWINSRARESQLKLGTFGILFAIMCLQWILSLWTGDRSAFYVGSAAGSALAVMVSLDGLSAQIFDILPVDIRKATILLSVAAFGIFLMLTFHELFQLKERSSVRHRIILTMASLMGVLGISTLVFGYGLAQYIAMLSLICTIVLIETLIWANRCRMRVAYVTDIALGLIIVPPLLNSQRYTGLLENSPFLDNANSIGFGLGFLAFSIAVADKMLLQRREREALLADVQNAQIALESLEASKVSLKSRNLELAQEMQEASLKLTNADQMATLGTMMAGIIHDMNNPLQFISDLDQVYTEQHAQLRKLLEALVGDATGPEADELRRCYESQFEHWARSTQDLKLGTEKLKSLSKAMRNSARRDPSPGHHTLRPVVDECIAILGSKLKLHTISCDIPDDLMIYVTRSQLSQILINLLSNARDATQEKYDSQTVLDYHPWIRISASLQEAPKHGIILCIEDNGHGIDSDEKTSIFETFYTTKAVGVGTGLGLSIIQRLMKGHSGDIKVSDSDLGGARFDLFFPAAKIQDDAVELIEEEPPEASRIA